MSVMTVLGERDAEQLGIIAPHEHVLLDVWSRMKTAGGGPVFLEVGRKKLFEGKVEMRLLGDLRLDVGAVKENFILDDVDLAVEELVEFKKYGGNALVDVTAESMGRDVVELQKISRLTGLDIITSTGFYIAPSHPERVAKESEERLARYMIDEVRHGIGDTGVRAGVIGEIGTSRGVLPEEKKVLHAAALAQRETGVPLYVHTWPFGTDGNAALDELERAGCDLTRVVVSHVDGQLNLDYCRSLLDRGTWIEFEHFGKEYREVWDDDIFIIPNDIDRLKEIRQLIRSETRYVRRILVSTDRCLKTEMVRYGGQGYAHILKTIVPYMRRLGFAEEEIDTLIRKNPQAMLTGE
jgi:phosphotriesterase-related protein